MSRCSVLAGVLFVGAVLLGCSSGSEGLDVDSPGTAPTATAQPDATDEPAETDSTDETAELFPDVLKVEARQDDVGTWTISATLSSPYDTPERYADGWRVLAPDGTELGQRPLTHDHQSEQPFTRSVSNVEIPAGITAITVQGRDQVSGWGGATASVELDLDGVS